MIYYGENDTAQKEKYHCFIVSLQVDRIDTKNRDYNLKKEQRQP